MKHNHVPLSKNMRKIRPAGMMSPRSSKRPARPSIVLWFVLLILVLLALFGWKGWRVYTLAQALRQDVRELETLAIAHPDLSTMESLEPLLGQTRQHATALRDEAQLLLYITPLFHWLPEYGDDLAAAGPLLDMTAGMAVALDETVSVLTPMVSMVDFTNPLSNTRELAEVLSAAHPQLEETRQAIDEASAARELINVDDLQPSLQTQVQRATSLLYLLEAGNDLVVAADETATVFLPVLSEDNAMQILDGSVAAQLAASRLQIERVQMAVARAAASWERVPLEQLPATLQNRVQSTPLLLQAARDSLELALVLPDLVGVNGSRTYLILVQNPDELRATGGFITAAGTITFEDGALEEWSIGDSTLMDDFEAGPYPAPPEPLKRYMGLGLWVLRDTNWSPDFPTTAEVAEELYTLAQGEDVDGVIAITPSLFQYVLAALGPLQVEGTPEAVTSDTIVQYFRDAWSPREAINKEWQERKTLYMKHLAQALLDRLQAGIDQAVLPDLVQQVFRALNERHLLVVVDNEKAAHILARRGWDGAVRPGNRDFLMVVDSNVGYNKANASIEQQVVYTVSLNEPERPSAIVTVQHTNTVGEPVPCQVQVVFLEGDYTDMTRTCYWNYLRVLVPEGSYYFGGNTHPTPAEWMFSEVAEYGNMVISEGPAETYQFATHLVIPTAEERQTSMNYLLPSRVVTRDEQDWHYRLKVQKQSGREAIPVQVKVRLPNTAVLVSTSHDIASQEDDTLVFNLLLAQDQMVDVVFTLPQ
jgi:hypothetical protein